MCPIGIGTGSYLTLSGTGWAYQEQDSGISFPTGSKPIQDTNR